MSTQQFFVSVGRTIRGPLTNRKKFQKEGRVAFTADAGLVYGSHDEQGNPVALPAGFVDYAKNKKESNGQTLLENLIEDGSIVFTPNTSSPVQFATPLPVDMNASGGSLVAEKK